MSTDVIARLAAANPVPHGATLHEPQPLRLRRIAIAVACVAAVAIPASAFASRLGDLLGISNPGSPVPTSRLSLSQDTQMKEAMQSLGFPSTMQLLGTRNGIGFYASRRADGRYCFALEVDGTRGGVSCDLDGSFPSPSDPVWIFPPRDNFAGFAADGVATVAGFDSAGGALVSAPVSDNLFAATPGDYTTVAVVEALDAQGNVVWTWRLPDR
jgi:hypothetical protein